MNIFQKIEEQQACLARLQAMQEKAAAILPMTLMADLVEVSLSDDNVTALRFDGDRATLAALVQSFPLLDQPRYWSGLFNSPVTREVILNPQHPNGGAQCYPVWAHPFTVVDGFLLRYIPKAYPNVTIEIQLPSQVSYAECLSLFFAAGEASLELMGGHTWVAIPCLSEVPCAPLASADDATATLAQGAEVFHALWLKYGRVMRGQPGPGVLTRLLRQETGIAFEVGDAPIQRGADRQYRISLPVCNQAPKPGVHYWHSDTLLWLANAQETDQLWSDLF